MKAELIKRNIKKEFNGWWIISLVGAVVILLPILFIFSSIFQEPNENWLHIRQYLLKNYVANTFTLVVLTGIFTAFLGVTLAWLIAAYDFPLKRFFRWGLILPLSIPTFIAIYTYRTMLGYTGVVQSTLRNHFDYQNESRMVNCFRNTWSRFYLYFIFISICIHDHKSIS